MLSPFCRSCVLATVDTSRGGRDALLDRQPNGDSRGDDELIAAAPHDPDAFAELYRRHAGRVPLSLYVRRSAGGRRRSDADGLPACHAGAATVSVRGLHAHRHRDRHSWRSDHPPTSSFVTYAVVQSSLKGGHAKGNAWSDLVPNINAEANVITARICHADDKKTAAVCNRPAIRRIMKTVK
jgi:hypothetical protein